MSRKTRMLLASGLLLGCMALTLIFSSEGGDQSHALSRLLARKIMIWFEAHVPIMESDLFWRENLNWLLRKAAHMAEYFLLGASGLLFLELVLRRVAFAIPAALLFTFAWAAGDEALQTLVGGRSGQVSDIWIDMVGAVPGVLGMALVVFLLHRFDSMRSTIRQLQMKLGSGELGAVGQGSDKRS